MGNGPKFITILSPTVLNYDAEPPLFSMGGETYASGLLYADVSESVPQMIWQPSPGSATTGVEHRSARDAMVAAVRA
jgi:hypothetical protein